MEELKRKRRGIKGSFTRLTKQINDLIENDDTVMEEYEARLIRVNELFTEFDTVQTRIEISTEESELDEEYNYRNEVELNYFSLKAKIQSVLKQGQNNDTVLQHDSHNDVTTTLNVLSQTQNQLTTIIQSLSSAQQQPCTSTPSNSSNNDSSSTRLPLPVIQIPTFNGNFKDWSPFVDMFESLVHNNNTLSSVQKFQYLKQSLQGEAASLLKHLPISEANYLSAYELLKKKYNREDYIIEAHLTTLLEYPPVRQLSATSLRKLTNTYEETVRALEALKLPVDKWDCWINFLLTSKLDTETQQLWRRESAKSTRPQFNTLIKFLEDRIFELVPINNLTAKDNRVHCLKFTNNNQQRAKSVHTAAALICVLCKGDHRIHACSSFTKLNVNDRHKLVTDKGLCFNCLNGKHLVKECKSLFRCQHCNKKHHTSLHNQSTENNVSDTKNQLASSNSCAISTIKIILHQYPTHSHSLYKR